MTALTVDNLGLDIDSRGRVATPNQNPAYAGVAKKMITVSCAGKEKKVMLKKRWLNNTREDMKEYNMAEEMAEHRSVWHMKLNIGPEGVYR